MTTGTLTIVSLITVFAILALVAMEVVNRRKRAATYVDNSSGTIIFYSTRYGISAKPDAIPNASTIEEFKSRSSGIYTSDRIQMIATALAVRSQYPIRRGTLITQRNHYDVDLSGSDAALFSLIEDEHRSATLIAKGIAPPPSPAKGKCRSCEFINTCDYQVGV